MLSQGGNQVGFGKKFHGLEVPGHLGERIAFRVRAVSDGDVGHGALVEDVSVETQARLQRRHADGRKNRVLHLCVRV